MGGSRGREARGTQYGNTRGKERQRRRREVREQDKERQRRMAEVHKERMDLERRIEEEARNPVLGKTLGAELQAKYQAATDEEARLQAEEAATEVVSSQESQRSFVFQWKATRVSKGGSVRDVTFKATVPFPPETAKKLPPPKQDGDIKWARSMFKQGYNVIHVMLATGVGIDWLSDFDIDKDGYYVEGGN